MLRAMGASVLAMVLVLVIGPAFIRWLRLNEFGQNIREDGPRGPQDQRRHADHGRRAHLVRRPHPLPHLQPLLGRVADCVHRRDRQRDDRLHRRLDQDRPQALARPLGALQAPAAAAALAVHRLRGAALRRRHHLGRRSLHLVSAGARHHRLLRADLPDARRVLQRREPHRRPGRAGGRRVGHRARRHGRHRLHHRAQHERPRHHRPHGHRRLRRRRGARVPLVQHVPGRRLHGGHRLARPRRRDRRAWPS